MIEWYSLYQKTEQRKINYYTFNEMDFIVYTDGYFHADNVLYFPTEEQGYNPDVKMYFKKIDSIIKVGFDTEEESSISKLSNAELMHQKYLGG